MKQIYFRCFKSIGEGVYPSNSYLFNLPLLLILTFLSFSSSAQSLIWRDEFNQTKVNDENWTREVGGGGNGNGELQYYTSGEQNVFIGSKTNASDTGYLVIEARR